MKSLSVKVTTMPKGVKQNAGSKLRDERLKRKVSLYAVHKDTGIHYAQLSHYEMKERTPNVGIAIKIARSLRKLSKSWIDIETLFDDRIK